MSDVPLFERAKNRGYHGFDKEKEGDWLGPFCFIQGADTQYGMIAEFFEVEGLMKWEREIELTRQAVVAANMMEPQPKFFIVCGDLVHAMPGTKDRDAQEEDLKKELQLLNSEIPLVCVCGNHDIGNTPTRQTIAHYVEKFGDDYFSFWVGGVKFLVLNSQLYEDPSEVMKLKDSQDKWLDQQLEVSLGGRDITKTLRQVKDIHYVQLPIIDSGQLPIIDSDAQTSGCKHLVIFQHIPWFLKDPNEEKEYFNIELNLRLRMLDKFHKAGVKTIFCGHYHRNAGGFYQNMEEVVTSAMGCPLGDDKSGLRVVRVFDKEIKHQYYAMSEIPKTIDLQPS